MGTMSSISPSSYLQSPHCCYVPYEWMEQHTNGMLCITLVRTSSLEMHVKTKSKRPQRGEFTEPVKYSALSQQDSKKTRFGPFVI